ncbi:MAG: XdhC family protein [Deltaproteobacteria bacterium]|jgi:xanthine dehydrogenase accessory factor|nr:XdhC family protein [Deltaproteobacteria bacterium]
MDALYKKLYEGLLSGRETRLTTTFSRSGTKKELEQIDDAASSAVSGTRENSLILRNEPELTVMERFNPAPRLIVFGGGHITSSLAPMAVSMDFELFVYDDRPAFASPARFPMARETFCEPFSDIARHLTLLSSDYVVITTRGHKHDEECLKFVLDQKEPFYAGMIGSKRRTAIVKKGLLAENGSPERLARLRSPIGLDIGAVTPPEIAVSILAEIVQIRRRVEKEKGLGCLEVYADMNLMRHLAADRSEGEAVITVIATSGSTPRKAGAKMAAFFDNRTIGSIGGGCAEAEILGQARSIIGTGGHLVQRVDLTDKAEEDGMVCGGWMDVLIEDLPPTTN